MSTQEAIIKLIKEKFKDLTDKELDLIKKAIERVGKKKKTT